MDIVKNTQLVNGMMLAVLKEKTRIPKTILESLSNRRYILTAKDCLKYGVCDEIIPLGFVMN
jgi:ATP-dependent protease ClpP protease subunit